MKIYLLIAMTLLTINCSSTKETKKSESNIKRIWMLVEFMDFKKEDLVAKKAFVDFTQVDRISAMMGCNNIGYDYVIKENKVITFSKGIATQMYCDDMKLENEFTKTIELMSSYVIVDQKLTLTSNNGIKMVFVAQD
jgi:heat shock protein HslJ